MAIQIAMQNEKDEKISKENLLHEMKKEEKKTVCIEEALRYVDVVDERAFSPE